MYDNREQEAAIRGKKRYAKRIFKWKVSVITGWETKETSCFLNEIFPFTVNLKRSKLNHAKAGRIC